MLSKPLNLLLKTESVLHFCFVWFFVCGGGVVVF